MIQLSSAGKRFGPKLLFEDLNWLITNHDRCGLVGSNGSGKTTLLRILAGLDSLDYGAVSSMKGMTLGYLPQDGLQLSGRTVFAECMSVFDNIRALQKELESLSHSMAELDPSSPEYRQVAERFHQAENEIHSRDGYTLDSQVGSVLGGLGFPREDWQRRTEEFSGGWQMRIALAKLLLEKPNLLLLDEPTNHLDLEARNWLEDYLKTYPHSYVVVSHDRYFLDITVTKLVEIWNKRAHFYTGGYTKYLLQKDERRTQLEAAYKNQRDRIEQLEAFINRFRFQATKAKQVQSRIKELDKIERIEIPPDEVTIHFKFPQPKPSGRVVAEFVNVSKSYGTKDVIGGVNFMIERNDRVALVGLNGAGKSTLIKLLAGIEPLTSGNYKLGHNVEPDYFAQDQYKELNPDSTMFEDISSISEQATNTELRSLLGCFRFSADDAFKRIGVLSGGERNRYALARLLLHPTNFLLLDEPTNHLDMRAKDVLLEAIEGYSGTVVFVSHDRYFIDKLATKVFEVADGSVHVFPGNYEEYQWKKAGRTLEPVFQSVTPVSEQAAIQVEEPSKKRRLNPMVVQQMQDRRGAIEEEVAKAETEIAEYEGALSDFKSMDETMRLTGLLDTRRKELESLLAEWEDVSSAIEVNS